MLVQSPFALMTGNNVKIALLGRNAILDKRNFAILVLATLGFQIDHTMGKKFTRLKNDIDIGQGFRLCNFS